MEMTITFPGGKKVNALYASHTIKTDQDVAGGGEGSAPEPFALFLASIGTCVGIYVLTFCQTRGIPTECLKLIQSHEFDPEDNTLKKIRIEIHVPPGFPEKYYKALARTANLCSIKKTMMNPPEFEIETRPARKMREEEKLTSP